MAAAAAPALAPDLAALRGVSVPLSEAALARAVEGAFLDTFWGSLAAPRVLASYRRLLSGDEFRRDWPGQGLQVANSYMEGLSATPFPDMDAPGYSWLRAVEEQVGGALHDPRRRRCRVPAATLALLAAHRPPPPCALRSASSTSPRPSGPALAVATLPFLLPPPDDVCPCLGCGRRRRRRPPPSCLSSWL